MTKSRGQRTRTYDVAFDLVLPSGEELAPPGCRTEETSQAWEATYVDTADLALHAQRVTLQRRQDETGTEWSLRARGGKGNVDARFPAGSETDVPAEASVLLAGVSLAGPLTPVAIVRHRRRTLRLLGPGDEPVLEVTDDLVHATALGDRAVRSEWRELQLIAVAGDEDLLLTNGQHLESLGALPSTTTGDLSRSVSGPGRPDPDQSDTSRVVGRFVRKQCHAVSAGDVALRHGLDSVHETRVAVRRLRSTLRVFAPIFEASNARALDLDLAWYAALLGAVRDREVQRARLADAVAALPAELVLGPVAAHIDDHLRAQQSFHHAALMRAIDGARYRALLCSLVAWAGSPPYADTLDEPDLLTRRARKAGRTATARLAAALDAGDPNVALHRARKAAKRARYSAELTKPLGVKKTKARIRHFKAVQDTLGAHQDSVLAARLLRLLGAAAGTTQGHNGFTYGLLFAREMRAAEDARTAAAMLNQRPGRSV
jgi:CHAD domain-containing protein